MIKNKNTKGFTLVELIVVIAIMLILGVVAVIAFSNVIDGATHAARVNEAEAIARQLNTANTLLVDAHRFTEIADITATHADGVLTLSRLNATTDRDTVAGADGLLPIIVLEHLVIGDLADYIVWSGAPRNVWQLQEEPGA